MKMLVLPSAKYLHECLTYFELTGELRWKKRPIEHFGGSQKEFIRWNKRHAGNRACSSIMKSGHVRFTLDYKLYLAHRIIWKMVTGKDPTNLIDHRNGKGGDNWWTNLREVDDSQSAMNRRKFKNNKSGYPGVGWCKQHRQWRVTIQVNNRPVEIGLFDDYGEAVAACKIARKKHHGEFVRAA